MLGLRPSTRFWLCTTITDMRNSYDGLAALAKNKLRGDPASGHVFIFINRRRTQLKCLYYEIGGYCLWCKRLEVGRFANLSSNGMSKLSLSMTEFSALVEGLDVVITKHRKRYKKPD